MKCLLFLCLGLVFSVNAMNYMNQESIEMKKKAYEAVRPAFLSLTAYINTFLDEKEKDGWVLDEHKLRLYSVGNGERDLYPTAFDTQQGLLLFCHKNYPRYKVFSPKGGINIGYRPGVTISKNLPNEVRQAIFLKIAVTPYNEFVDKAYSQRDFDVYKIDALDGVILPKAIPINLQPKDTVTD